MKKIIQKSRNAIRYIPRGGVARPKGFTVLLVMLVMTAVIVIIALGMGLSSITENQINLNQSQSGHMLINMDGCAEEALTQLNRNNSYSGGTFSIENTSCLIIVTGSGSTRTVHITGTKMNYTKRIQMNVIIFPSLQVTSWQEINY